MRQQGYDEDLIEASMTFHATDDPFILKARELFRSLKTLSRRKPPKSAAGD
jgi:hypothetical protein